MDYPLRLANQLQAHLRALRKHDGLTQAQLGQKLGIGQVRVAEIEAKPGSVRIDQLIQLLAALGATLVLRHAHGVSRGAPSTRGTKPKRSAAQAATPPPVKKAAVPKRPRADPAQPVIPVLRIPPKRGSW